MWPTVDGLRTLRDAEADLVRGGLGMMLDHLIEEFRGEAETWRYGIDAFDMWDVEQRIWLLDQIAGCLLTTRQALPPAAIWEAAIDAIFCEIIDLIEIEIADPTLTTTPQSWRESVLDAYECQYGRAPYIDADAHVLSDWRAVVSALTDSILPSPSYQKAEAFRDAEFERTASFLASRCLPGDFLQQIPPVRTVAETQASIDQIQKFVFA
ncbi:hypothetical protein [Rubripirellula reticaptiva]|uniref:Uncharacterized protein n=1 Tax=Rubripirellula reticaptiva TaxID=2528013 RepID=A0A5C6EHB0_9BACT|nr:hypothetical protein [Rubripirellula reticaptiva]TWU47930.1 hypothetical protein Poly59_47740 [Rubripirellula reticaptiva]